MNLLLDVTKDDLRPLFQSMSKSQLVSSIEVARIAVAADTTLLEKYKYYITALYNEDISFDTDFSELEINTDLQAAYADFNNGMLNFKTKKFYKHYNIKVYTTASAKNVIKYTNKSNVSKEIQAIATTIGGSDFVTFLSNLINNDFSIFVSIDEEQAKILTLSSLPLLSALLNYSDMSSNVKYQAYISNLTDYSSSTWNAYHEYLQKFMDALSSGTINY